MKVRRPVAGKGNDNHACELRPPSGVPTRFATGTPTRSRDAPAALGTLLARRTHQAAARCSPPPIPTKANPFATRASHSHTRGRQ
jgi:hypothetical protein